MLQINNVDSHFFKHLPPTNPVLYYSGAPDWLLMFLAQIKDKKCSKSRQWLGMDGSAEVRNCI